MPLCHDSRDRVWSLRDAQLLRTLKGHTGWVTSVSLTPDGLIVSGSEDKTLR
jgi:WD40 repeat protein